MVKLYTQSDAEPSRMHDAIRCLLGKREEALKICVAYLTEGGVDLLDTVGGQELGSKQWNDTDKQIITSLDYGITSPLGLRAMLAIPRTSLRIADVSVVKNAGMRPRTAFHAKGFCVHGGDKGAVLTGSCNLTRRALTTNTEMAILTESIEVTKQFLAAFSQFEGLSVATEELISNYENARSQSSVSVLDNDDEVPTSLQISTVPPAFAEFITQHDIKPFQRFWIEAGTMSSSGSRHQLELPRFGSRFFGYAFDAYGGQQEDIGQINLSRGGIAFSGRRIVWHGDNGMERLYLPTEAQGGPSYINTAILFERIPDANQLFAFTVEPWESPVANSWRNASILGGTVFRVPFKERTDARICGLLA